MLSDHPTPGVGARMVRPGGPSSALSCSLCHPLLAVPPEGGDQALGLVLGPQVLPPFAPRGEEGAQAPLLAGLGDGGQKVDALRGLDFLSCRSECAGLPGGTERGVTCIGST